MRFSKRLFLTSPPRVSKLGIFNINRLSQTTLVVTHLTTIQLLRLLFASIVFVSISGCASYKLGNHIYIGTYKWKSDEGARAEITLHKSGTYNYSYSNGLYWQSSTGTWKKNKDKLILSSELQKPKNNFEVLNVAMEDTDSISLQVVDSDNKPIPYVKCILMAGSKVLMESTTDLKGIAALTRINKKSTLQLSMTGMKFTELNISSGVSSLTVEMHAEDWDYRYFKSERWKFSETRLYDPVFKNIKSNDLNFYEFEK